MAGGVFFPPLEEVPEGVVQQPHVEMAEFALALQYQVVANGLALVGGHFLAVVLIPIPCQPPHLGRNLGIADFKMEVGNAGLDGPQFGKIVKGAVAEHDDAASENDALDTTGRGPGYGPLLLAIVATLTPAGTTEDALGVLVLDDPLHIFQDVDGSGILRQCLEEPPTGHPAVEELEIDPKPLEFAKDSEGFGDAAGTVKEEAVGKAKSHALGVVLDELELRLVGGEMKIVFGGGGSGGFVGEQERCHSWESRLLSDY